MLFHQYQHEAHKFSNPDLAKPMQTAMACMGLAGEAGELIDELKKFLFHSKDLDREKVIKEIGDVLWYLAEVATCFEIPLADAAMTNLQKLNKRHGGAQFKPHNEQDRSDEAKPITGKKQIQVWSEGYQATGERADATLHGTYEAETLEEAVKQHIAGLKPEQRKYWNKNPQTGSWFMWGCKVFDNEADARRSFG